MCSHNQREKEQFGVHINYCVYDEFIFANTSNVKLMLI